MPNLPTPFTVADLIAHLQTLPPDILVVYQKYSDHQFMELKELELIWGCAPRPDGYVQGARPDLPQQQYLLFPGN